MLFVKILKKCKLTHESSHLEGGFAPLLPAPCGVSMGWLNTMADSVLTYVTWLFKSYVTFPGHEVPKRFGRCYLFKQSF
jgi:hypothetical protein